MNERTEIRKLKTNLGSFEFEVMLTEDGSEVLSHNGLDDLVHNKLMRTKGLRYEYIPRDVSRAHNVVECVMRMPAAKEGEEPFVVTGIGESGASSLREAAMEDNPSTMAYKRAFDKAVLSILGLKKYLLDSEADKRATADRLRQRLVKQLDRSVDSVEEPVTPTPEPTVQERAEPERKSEPAIKEPESIQKPKIVPEIVPDEVIPEASEIPEVVPGSEIPMNAPEPEIIQPEVSITETKLEDLETGKLKEMGDMQVYFPCDYQGKTVREVCVPENRAFISFVTSRKGMDEQARNFLQGFRAYAEFAEMAKYGKGALTAPNPIKAE